MIQKTYILDTNVYGEILIEMKSEKILKSVKEDKATYIYGIDIIENELKDAPAGIKHKGKILREAVLTIYRTLIDGELELSPVAKYLASEYPKKSFGFLGHKKSLIFSCYNEFDKLRRAGKYYRLIDSKIKKYTEDDLRVDFQIIAMASLKGIDVVVSTDRRTILSNIAEDTYNKVNKLNGLRTPRLVRYSNFKERYT